MRAMVAPVRNEIGRILYTRNLREHDLARQAGVTESHLNRIKNGRVVPSLATALRICAALELPVEHVFRLDVERRRTLRAAAGSATTSAPGRHPADADPIATAPDVRDRSGQRGHG